ncbi:transmembrane protein [Ceratobasidium theobromae]|uniref:Transmembrane protein n=1 Tax=Ceratobasidium theobromae TaxID=1582974 RepID=A0A5N5QFG6_9AGAM|nr:transmembrane protein [Ceratobasidium theobromae]
MQSFGRLLSVLTFLLSLGFVARALPSPARSDALTVRSYNTPDYKSTSDKYTTPYENDDRSGSKTTDPSQSNSIDILGVMVGLKGQLTPKVALLAKANTVVDATVEVTAIVDIVKNACAPLANVTLNVAADVQVRIAHIVVDILVAIISACATVSARLGVSVCLSLWAQIDVVLHLLILTLNACISGLLKLIIDLCANLDAEILAHLDIIHLDLCVKILGLAAKLSALSH